MRLLCLDQALHDGDPALPAVGVRHLDPALDLRWSGVGERVADRRRKCGRITGDRNDVPVLGVEPADLRQVGGHHRDAHRQVLVQLGRVDVGGVLGQPVGHDADVEAFHVARQLVMLAQTQQVDIGTLPQPGDVGLLRADERERRVRHRRRGCR